MYPGLPHRVDRSVPVAVGDLVFTLKRWGIVYELQESPARSFQERYAQVFWSTGSRTIQSCSWIRDNRVGFDD